MMSYRRFFAELKRRHVFKVAAIYGGVGFVLLQVAELLGQGLRLPEWFLPLVTALVLLGFPLALVVAWAFELTPDGVQRTAAAARLDAGESVPEPTTHGWRSGLLAFLGVAVLTSGAWWIGTRTEFGDARSADALAPDGAERLAMEDELVDAGDNRPSIAVLPFEDMSPEGDQTYFSDGITEEILNTLAKVDGLKVAARTSAFAFRDQSLDMRAIGDSLNVGYLIEGSVRKAGDQLRITAQLIDSDDGTHLWSEAYNRSLDDVFAIQIEIARAIADELRLPLGLTEQDELVTPTADLEAYDLYLEGRARIRERGESLREAARLFEAALAHDSTWAPAWAALAETLELTSWYPAAWEGNDADARTQRRRLWSDAEAAARRALTLDADLPSARVALGSVYRNRRKWDAAEREYRRALAVDPDNPEAHQQYADLLGGMGRIREARASAERAVRLDPAPVRRHALSSILWADGRYDESLRMLRELIASDPEAMSPDGLRHLYYLHAMQIGRYDDALRYGLDFLPDVSPGQHAQMVRALREGDPSLVPEGGLGRDPYFTVFTWHRFDEPERAFTGIRRTLAETPHQQTIWLWHPVLDPLREYAEFQDALIGLNLEGHTVDRTPRRS